MEVRQGVLGCFVFSKGGSALRPAAYSASCFLQTTCSNRSLFSSIIVSAKWACEEDQMGPSSMVSITIQEVGIWPSIKTVMA